ncbi:MAG: hypothetical protein R2991_12775 [Thermoanaerobaculia bacterium]
MKLARDFDARFESLLLTGRVAKWYSEVGNEATTVPAGLVLERRDVLSTLPRPRGDPRHYARPRTDLPGALS